MLARKLEYVVLYVTLMGVGFLFEPPLLYTQYPLHMTALLVFALVLDHAHDIQGRNRSDAWEMH